MAWSITTVAWSVIEFREAYIQAGLHERVLEMVRWGSDYFMKAHPEDNVFYVQVISLLHIRFFSQRSFILFTNIRLGARDLLTYFS